MAHAATARWGRLPRKPCANGRRHRRRVFDGREVSDVVEDDNLGVIGESGLEFIGLPQRYPRIIPTPADTNRAAGGFQSIRHRAGVRCAECCDLPVERRLSDGAEPLGGERLDVFVG